MRIPVELGAQSYYIIIENGALDNIGDLLDLNRKVLVVTDSGVPETYAEKVAARCGDPTVVTVPQGEKSKSPENFLKLLSAMLEKEFTRKDCVVAVGGGVVGDLSGFAASCYMRGIDFYNVPTTLLSQIDSSVGGKTAVDLDGVKNAIGTFYQPKKVIIDPTVLKTLDERQLRAGLADAIKMAATCDGELFGILEKSDSLAADLPTIIERALLIKKNVVEKDPDEKGLRKVLNFGHTIGHAIESASEGRLLHGECVALGMLPMCGKQARERIENVLKKYGLPTETERTPEELLPFVKHDKKAAFGTVSTVFVPTIGQFEFKKATPEELFGEKEI